jgi:alpha-beta hydrolase superfamily lysophospholipase
MSDTAQHTEGHITGASGDDIYWQSWVPEIPKAIVMIAHGYAEHSGRYAHVAERLARSDYAVYAIDHVGHGRSQGTKGNFGRLAHVLTDLDTLLRQASNEHPGLPVFLLGHSVGALIALDYAQTKGEEHLQGLVLSGAAVDPNVGSRVERLLAKVLSRIAPNLPVTPLDSTTVSRNPDVVAAYDTDPLNYHGRIRVRTGSEVITAVERINRLLPAVTLPILVMHGGSDRLASPIGSEIVATHAGSLDLTHKVYEGLYHEIFNEPEQDAVLDDVVAWLDAHV